MAQPETASKPGGQQNPLGLGAARGPGSRGHVGSAPDKAAWKTGSSSPLNPRRRSPGAPAAPERAAASSLHFPDVARPAQGGRCLQKPPPKSSAVTAAGGQGDIRQLPCCSVPQFPRCKTSAVTLPPTPPGVAARLTGSPEGRAPLPAPRRLRWQGRAHLWDS